MQLISLLLPSEVIAEDSTLYLQKALSHLREIWELIGIPEDQRLLCLSLYTRVCSGPRETGYLSAGMHLSLAVSFPRLAPPSAHHGKLYQPPSLE